MAYPRTKGTAIGEKAKRPKPGIPLNKALVHDQIIKHKGNISRVADAIGSCRVAVRNFVERHDDLKALLASQRERIIDELETHVFDRALAEKDTTLQLFILKTQARHRGWDQDEAKNAAKDIATAAFEFIVSKSKTDQ